MKATIDNIGDILYPIDNSWSKFLDNDEMSNPANLYGQESDPIEITSAPYMVTVELPLHESDTKYIEREFVKAKWKGREIRILNNFYNSKEDMEYAAECQSKENLM